MGDHKIGILMLGVSAAAWCGFYFHLLRGGWHWVIPAFAAVYVGWAIWLMVVCKCGEEEKKSKGSG